MLLRNVSMMWFLDIVIED